MRRRPRLCARGRRQFHPLSAPVQAGELLGAAIGITVVSFAVLLLFRPAILARPPIDRGNAAMNPREAGIAPQRLAEQLERARILPSRHLYFGRERDHVAGFGRLALQGIERGLSQCRIAGRQAEPSSRVLWSQVGPSTELASRFAVRALPR